MLEELKLSVPTSSLGARRVRLTFNPSEKQEVREVKELCAEGINAAETIKQNLLAQATEVGAAGDLGEIARLAALAQTALEEAAMWLVKLATYPIPKPPQEA